MNQNTKNMKNRFLQIGLLFLLLLFGFFLRAQTISSDRPGVGDGASIVLKNKFQLETGLEFARYRPGESYMFNQNTLPIALLRYGLSDKIELRLLQSYFVTDRPKLQGDYSNNGFSNTSIGAKFRLAENTDRGTQAALLFDLVVPTGSQEVALNKFLASLRHLFSWNFSEQANLTSNIGVYWAEEQAISLTYSFAVGYAINDKWGVFIEPFGEVFQFDDFSIAIDGGLTYLLNSKMQFDASAGSGINNDFYFMGLGFSWLITK